MHTSESVDDGRVFVTHTHTSLLVHTSICNRAANLLIKHSRKTLKWLESARNKGSGAEDFFRGKIFEDMSDVTAT
jgi:hypothetical protein